MALTAICAELCFQTPWGHIPLLCAKLEPDRNHLRSKNMAKVYPNPGFECMLLIGQNKHSKFTYNTLRILPVTMTFAVLCWQTGCIPQLFATFEPWRRHLRRVTSAKGSQKPEFYMLAFDWLEQTDKIGCNIFPARMTCAVWAMVPDCLGTLSST